MRASDRSGARTSTAWFVLDLTYRSKYKQMRMLSAIGVYALMLLGLFACSGPRPPEWHEEDGYRWTALSVPRRGRDGFRQLAPSKTGVMFMNTVTEQQILENHHVLNGSGVTLGDIDDDGLLDIYFSRFDGPNVLYRSLGGWRFEDITERAGVGAPDRFSTGVAFADTDGDGDLDLLVTALGGPNALFVNDGTGMFEERREEAGLSSHRGSTTVTLADVDGDGDLDLYLTNYKVKSVKDVFPPQVRAFDRVVQEVDGRRVIRPEFREHYGLTMQQNRLMRFEYGEPDQFYLNDGTGRFEEVSFTSGWFRDESGEPLTTAPLDWGLSARFYDINGDGAPDLYVCNDFESPDRIWINDGSGRFRLTDPLALRTTSQSSMAVDFSDLDRDGDVDFLTVDMLDRDSRRRKTQRLPMAPEQPGMGEIEQRLQQPRNTLFVNRGDGTYTEAAYLAGVAASGWSWSVLFMDVDLDGYEDALVATGHTYDFLDLDARTRMPTPLTTTDWRARRLLFPELYLKNVAFRNNGQLTFDEVGEAWGFGNEEDVSHGMATGDLDGDGDLDVVVSRLGWPAAVFRNESNRKRIAVRLKGQAPNTQGIGAKIHILGGPVPDQSKEVTLGGMYLSSSEPLYTFAAGDADELSIVVQWRSGQWSVVDAARPNRLYEIDQTGALAPSDLPGSVTSVRPAPRPETPFFKDVTAALGHTHAERSYNDFGRQPLLPHRLSQLGPGVTWYDVDRDGDEDLLVTSGAGGTLGYYRNDGGHLSHVTLQMDPAPLDQTTVVAIPDGHGGTSLLLGQMNYESESPAAALAAASVLHLELRGADPRAPSIVPHISHAVAGAMSSTGPLALADYDGDGDLDLFVGGRVLPARYPTPASSRLYRNDEGTLTLDPVNSQTFAEIGLVAGAVFSDVDGDGDPDLLLALEWGPLRLFLNQQGRFADAGAAWGLAPFVSQWNGVTTGDLNGDGRPDIVATSWGRNTRYRVEPGRPLLLYYGDFDRNGTLDLIEAQFDPSLEGIVPLASPQRTAMAIPFTRLGTRIFAAYAEATMEDLMGPRLADARRLAVTTFDQMLFLNRGTSFEPVSLPVEAQLAPAFYAGVADFDGDGHEDLFLSQNFFPTASDAPRYDAGRALWLRGDGTGRLQAVPGLVSGVTVYGDQRGAALADFNADGRVDLVVSQNANVTKLYRNERGKPGLRVRLLGTAGNPHAFGASIRLVYRDRRGPAREIHAGSGYWSQDGPIQVLGMWQQPTAVWVRWPGGRETITAVEPGTREMTIRVGDGG